MKPTKIIVDVDLTGIFRKVLQGFVEFNAIEFEKELTLKQGPRPVDDVIDQFLKEWDIPEPEKKAIKVKVCKCGHLDIYHFKYFNKVYKKDVTVCNACKKDGKKCKGLKV